MAPKIEPEGPMATATLLQDQDPAFNKQVETLSGQIFEAVIGAQQVQAAWLGEKLGWYQCLASHGPLSTRELAKLTASSERYAREWCEHQTVSGWISCPDVTAAERIYFLSAAQKEVLINKDSLAYMLPLCKFTGNLGRHVDQMKEAYQNDQGIGWDELGSDAREGQAEMNRPMFLQLLGKEYIPQGLPSVDKILQERGGRVADIGAGFGWSSIGLAQAYPKVTVDAFDLDQPSVDQANRNIRAAGLEGRVTARCEDIGSANVANGTSYDLVMALECIHDMGDPVSVLSNMRNLAGDSGTVLIMDEKVQETFTGDSTNLVERFMYGASLTCCLADCKSHPNSAETGTVMRPSKLQWYAIEAGFRGVEILPIEHDFFRFYLLKR